MKHLVLQLRYLTGRCVATAYNDRERAEWPPHPARVYSALVATWAEGEAPVAAEREALEWLAQLDAPAMYASEAARRPAVPHFVPVNDVAVLGDFSRARHKLAETERALEQAKADYESAKNSGDQKAINRFNKSVAKTEKAVGKARQKLQQLLEADQQPFATGKHPATGLKSARGLLPEHRGKQPRSFPSVTPDDPRVCLRWSGPDEELERHAPALADLASRVVRVGHSTSLVACSLTDECPRVTWQPDDSGDEVLRVPGSGQFGRLMEAFERHQEIEPRVLPCRFQPYKKAGSEEQIQSVATLFDDDWTVFRHVGGRRLSQTSCAEFARAMRRALMSHADDPPPELLSGHTKDGEPTNQAHVAMVPLPSVGHIHARGDLLGIALVFPRNANPIERQAVLRAIGLWENERRLEDDDELVDTPVLELALGRAGVVMLERVDWGVAPLKTLRSDHWCRPSRPSHAWVTATPIALDRNPGNLSSQDSTTARKAFEAAEQSIAIACGRIGLPSPRYVQIHPSVPLNGTIKARAYPPFPKDPKKHQRVKVHARIEFPVPVSGPVLLGAGRYHGLGLCFPQPYEAMVQE